MVLNLSFKLLPNRRSEGVRTSLAKERSFAGKILDKYYLLTLPSSIFAITTYFLLVQILMTLDN